MASDSKKLMAMMARAVAAFQASPEPLQVMCTLPHGRLGPEPRPPQRPVQRIVVLDSSFNPPTRAHGQMAMEALAAAAAATEDDSEDQELDKEAAAAASRGEQEDRQPETCHEMPVRLRLLLLLAVRNADKAPAPASLPARLVMMEALARKLLSMAGPAAGLEIDVSVTTMPFFHDKALAVAESRFYGSAPPALLFAVGFDTLVRILDPRYYGRSRASASASASAYGDDASPAMQAALGRFFDRARLHVTTRPIDGDGTQQRAAVMQRLYELGGGAWAARVKVCDGATAEMAGVSSSRARETARAGSLASLDRLVDAEVRAVVLSEALYCEGAS